MNPIWRKSWPEGLPNTQNYPEVPVWNLLEGSVRRHPDKPCIIFEGTEYSYARIWEMVEKCATALHGLGIGKGDVVAVHMPNCPQFVVAYYGLLRAGATYSPCNPTLSAKELTHQLSDCGARAIFTLDSFAPLIKQIKDSTRLETIIVSDIKEILGQDNPGVFSDLEAGWHRFSRLIAGASPSPPEVSINPQQDLAHIAYTGGTTGVSKGVMLTHFNVVADCLHFVAWFAGGVIEMENGFARVRQIGEKPGSDQWEYPMIIGDGTAVVVVPLFHAMGINGYLNLPIACGYTIVLHPRLDKTAYLRDIEKYKATFIGSAPALFTQLLSVPEKEKMNLSSVRIISLGGAPCPVEVMKRIKAKFPEAVLQEGYGLTEVTMGATSNPVARHSQRKIGAVGLPFFDTEIKIVDSEDGNRELPFGESGEICIRGPQVMKGYLNRPEATAEVLKDGWLYTGDIGRIDEDGYLFITDRKKDMLIYKG